MKPKCARPACLVKKPIRCYFQLCRNNLLQIQATMQTGATSKKKKKAKTMSLELPRAGTAGKHEDVLF